MTTIRITSGNHETGQVQTLEQAIERAKSDVPWHRAVVFWTSSEGSHEVLAVRPTGGVARLVDFRGDVFAWWAEVPEAERALLAENPHRGFKSTELPSQLGKSMGGIGMLSLEAFWVTGMNSHDAQGLTLSDDVADFIDAVTGASLQRDS